MENIQHLRFALLCVVIQMTTLFKSYLHTSMVTLTTIYFISIILLVVLYEIIFHNKKNNKTFFIRFITCNWKYIFDSRLI
jgi:hypothetical protein